MVVLGYTNLPICILSHLINGTFLIPSNFKPLKLYLTKQTVFLVIRTILSFSWSQWSILQIVFIISNSLTVIHHFRHEKRSGAKMCPAIVSRIQWFCYKIQVVIHVLVSPGTHFVKHHESLSITNEFQFNKTRAPKLKMLGPLYNRTIKLETDAKTFNYSLLKLKYSPSVLLFKAQKG